MARDGGESSGEVTDSRRSSSRRKAEGREGAREGMEACCRSGERHGVQVDMLGLTGEVAVDVRPPWGIHALIGRRLTKLNRLIQSPLTVIET